MAAYNPRDHEERENGSSLDDHLLSGVVQGLRAREEGNQPFQNGRVRNVKIARRALRPVNQIDRAASTISLQLGLKPPVEDENRADKRSMQPDGYTPVYQTTCQNKTEAFFSSLLPDIEYRLASETPEDSDDESIYLDEDRKSKYIERILNWRSSCLFGTASDSDNEEEERRKRRRITEELQNNPITKVDDQEEVMDLLCYEEFKDDDQMSSDDGTDNIQPMEDNYVICSSPADGQCPPVDDSQALSSHLGQLVLNDSLPNSSTN